MAASSAAARFSPQEAMAAIARHCIEMDGMVTTEEQEALQAALSRVPLMGGPAQVQDALRTVNERLRKDGPEAVLEAAIHATPTGWRPHAYDVAMRLVGADGDVADDDQALLDRLKRDFRL